MVTFCIYSDGIYVCQTKRKQILNSGKWRADWSVQELSPLIPGTLNFMQKQNIMSDNGMARGDEAQGENVTRRI